MPFWPLGVALILGNQSQRKTANVGKQKKADKPGTTEVGHLIFEMEKQ